MQQHKRDFFWSCAPLNIWHKSNAAFHKKENFVVDLNQKKMLWNDFKQVVHVQKASSVIDS